jgi:hypothetical protein
MLRDATISMEIDMHSIGNNIEEDGKEPLREGEEDLLIVNGLTRLQLVISLRSLTRDDERIWRNPLFDPPPFFI